MDALIPPPFHPERPTTAPNRLFEVAQAQLTEARDRHGFGPQHEILAELILDLARAAGAPGSKAYARAQLAKELRECLAALPGDGEADPMAQLTQHLERVNASPAVEGVNTATPSWATPPTPGAPNDLAAVREVAAMLGTPLMPWQANVARVATERREDGSWRWPVVVVTVPRQSGKTTLMRSVLVQRTLMRPRHLAFYTAQTGKDARARWMDLVEAAEAAPLTGPLATVRKAAGDSALSWPNGSKIGTFAPTPKSLHGYTPPLVMTDECFAFDLAAGNALEGAIRPAQITLRDRQWWIVSTAGTADSGWLRRWVDLGRQSVQDGAESGIAYFEYSLGEGDPYDREAWRSFHPALGLTVDEDALAADAASTPRGEWERAYCNRWTSTSDSVIPLDVWDSLGRDQLPKPHGTIGLGLAVAEDRSEAALWAAWITPDDRAALRVVRAEAGIAWLEDAVREARAVLGESAVVVATEDGPVRQITDRLRQDHVDVLGLAPRDFATACGSLLWRASNGILDHDRSPALRAAVTVAQTRPMGDGSYGFARRASNGSIAALEAATVALRAAEHVQPGEAPKIYFPDTVHDNDEWQDDQW